MMYGNEKRHQVFYDQSEWFQAFSGAFPNAAAKTKQGAFLVLTIIINWILVAAMVYHTDLAEKQQLAQDTRLDLAGISVAWAFNILLVFGCISMYIVSVCCSSVPRLDIAWHIFGWLLLGGMVLKAMLLMMWLPMYVYVYGFQRQVDSTSMYFLWQELQLFLYYVLCTVVLVAGYVWCRFRAKTVGKRRM
jgi:hypothetical protein